MNDPTTGAGRAPELSRVIMADAVGEAASTVEIDASPEERAALAGRFDLLSVDRLRARAVVRRAQARDGSGPVLRVDFDISADIVQRCVVSLEPVAARVEETGLVAEYRVAGDPALEAEVEVAPEGIDPPELLTDGTIDLGELVAEHLALAIDPYPRAEGAAAEWPDGEKDEPAETPFAVLRDWPGRGGSDSD